MSVLNQSFRLFSEIIIAKALFIFEAALPTFRLLAVSFIKSIPSLLVKSYEKQNIAHILGCHAGFRDTRPDI